MHSPQVYIDLSGCSPKYFPPQLVQYARTLLKRQVLFGSDYPHWDMDVPSVIWDLPFLSEKAKRNILGENARRVFNIDVKERFPNYKAA